MLRRFEAALVIDVSQPQLDRIDVERVREARDHRLRGELRLRRTEPAKRAGGHVVRVDDVSVGGDVFDVVTTAREKRRTFEYFRAGRGVRAAVGEQFRFYCDDSAVLARAPLRADEVRMAFVMADDRFFAAPDDCRRPLQLPRREREQRLDVQILTAAERPADVGVTHDDVVLGELQHFCDLPAIFVQPLTCGLDDELSVFVVSDAGVRLQVRVLLPRRFERFFEHHVRCGKAGLHVALANANVLEHVASAIGVNERRIGRHRRARVADRRQIFVRHFDEFGRTFGCGSRLRCD